MSGRARTLFHAIVAMAVISVSTSSNAQDLEPRRYANVPVGQNFLALAYSYSEGDVNVAPSAPLEDAVLRIDGPALAYLRSFDIGGKSSSMDFALPYVCVAGSAILDGERLSGQRCGFGDTLARVSYNFFGAPAVELSEFAGRSKQMVVGASVQVSIPSGDYDNTKLVNIGSNRWYIRPEIGMSIPWRKLSFEFAAGVRFFSANDDLLEGSRLEQDPLYNLQAHIHYDFSQRQSVSVSSNYFFGGETFRDEMPSAISQENSRLGASWTYAFNSKHIIKLVAHTGVITRIGNDSDVMTVAWSYRWD
jgi:hypothetical protein